MDLEQTWQTVLGELEVTISKANFTTWFSGTSIHHLEKENKKVILGVRNNFAKDWLENKYQKEIKNTLKKFIPSIEEVEFRLSPTQAPVFETNLEKKEKTPLVNHLSSDIIPHYVFDTFVVGNSNRLAYAVSKAVSEKPGITHNPLFIYGGVGLGKTHLIHAIGNEIAKKNPKVKIIYVSCENFTNEFIQAISMGTINEFKNRYRNIDVFLVDDIQFLSKKEGTQEEFFHTFNALHQSKRQIVVTSDRVPTAIPELEERLSSRFGWGMVADIKSPDLETRIAILQQKSKEKNLTLSGEVIDYIASNIQSNIRELEGALNRVSTYCQLYNVELTIEHTQKALEDLIDRRKSDNLSVETVISSILDFFNLEKELFFSPKKTQEVVYPRQIAMYLMRHELNLSFPKICRELQRKDHTTIIHGCEKIEKEISRNEKLQRDLTQIKERLYIL